MEKKHLAAIVVVLVGLGAFFAYPQVRLLQFQMDADKMLETQLGRFPTPEQLVNVDASIVSLAKERGYQSVTCKKNLAAKSMGGTGDIYYELEVEVTVDGKEAHLRQRVDTDGIQNEFGALQEAGITIDGK